MAHDTRELRCPVHPGARVRRYRTIGPRGRGIYPQCIPADGSPAHLVPWDEALGAPAPIVAEVRVVPSAALGTGLTASELAVLGATANGLSVTETARCLGKSSETVKTQRKKTLLKLGARNAPQAVCLATDQGILTVDHGRDARAA